MTCPLGGFTDPVYCSTNADRVTLLQTLHDGEIIRFGELATQNWRWCRKERIEDLETIGIALLLTVHLAVVCLNMLALLLLRARR